MRHCAASPPPPQASTNLQHCAEESTFSESPAFSHQPCCLTNHAVSTALFLLLSVSAWLTVFPYIFLFILSLFLPISFFVCESLCPYSSFISLSLLLKGTLSQDFRSLFFAQNTFYGPLISELQCFRKIFCFCHNFQWQLWRFASPQMEKCWNYNAMGYVSTLKYFILFDCSFKVSERPLQSLQPLVSACTAPV